MVQESSKRLHVSETPHSPFTFSTSWNMRLAGTRYEDRSSNKKQRLLTIPSVMSRTLIEEKKEWPRAFSTSEQRSDR